MATTSAGLTNARSQKSSESVVVSPGSANHKLDDVPECGSPDSVAKVPVRSVSPTTPLLSPRALYLRAKKEIESKLKQRGNDDSDSSHDPTPLGEPHNNPRLGFGTTPRHDDCRTQATVEGTRTYLASQNITKTGTWFKDELHTSKIGRKLFGKAPWHRKESADSFISVSSSMRAVLKGRTPPTTPMAQHLSYASGFNSITNPFPGGEAVRVSTPPLDEATADGKPRGFFTSMTPPVSDAEIENKTNASSSIRSGSQKSIHSTNLISQPREWWEQMPQRFSRRGDIMDASARKFEFDVPEHLPSSPMCPANSRHKSGGTGLCVYHGRRRAKSMLRDKARGKEDKR